MKKHIFLAFTLCCLTLLPAMAQVGGRIRITTDTLSTRTPQTTVRPRMTHRAPVADTLYSTQTKKQHGWIAPLDTVPPDFARHRNATFRFSQRNAQGLWQKMEVIDAYGHYVPGLFNPYILNISSADTDKEANTDWVEKIKTACIYEFIADATGRNVVQERAYDKNHQIVYVYTRTPIGRAANGRRRYVGSYKDNYGLPAEMRSDSAYTYGTLVMLTEDRFGNDSIIEYMDAKGVRKLNADGVARQVYVCDSLGRLLKQQSCDADGRLTIDNWGNCGVEYVWNDNHTIARATYMDDHWQPMRMPDLRTKDKDNVIQTRYEYDQYKRQVRQAYFTADGQHDTDSNGVHSTTSRYDARGNYAGEECRDKQGKLTPNYYNWAVYQADFDSLGRMVNRQWLDAHRKPSSYNLSRERYAYDDHGRTVFEAQYELKDGKEVLAYSKELTDRRQHIQWSDGSTRTDTLDRYGRILSTTFRDSLGQLEEVSGWARRITKYTDGPHRSMYTTRLYDRYGQLVVTRNKVAVFNVLTDSLTHRDYKYNYTTEGELIESFLTQWDSTYTVKLREWDSNRFGRPCRAGGAGGTRHYSGQVFYTPQGDDVAIIGRDELDEPDYIYGSNSIYYYSRRKANGEDVYFDEHNRPIADMDSLRDHLPKVMTVEVTDSAAYAMGLRDNDVILLFGSYAARLHQDISYAELRKEWTLRTVADAAGERRLVVFRLDPATGQGRLVEVRGLRGTASQCGFLAHIRYLTARQQQRISQAVDDNMASDAPLLTAADLVQPSLEGDNYVVLAYTELFRNLRNEPYAQQVTDPALLLGACIHDEDMRWMVSRDTKPFEDALAERKVRAVSYPEMVYYLTRDLEHITPLHLEQQAAYTSWFDAFVSDEIYARVQAMAAEASRQMDQEMAQPSPYTTQDLTGYWQVVMNSTGIPKMSGTLYLAPDGSAQGGLTEELSHTFNEGTAVYQLTHDFTGRWTYRGRMLRFDTTADDNTTLHCTDLLDAADADLRQRAVAYQDGLCQREKALMLNNLPHVPWNKSLFIRSLQGDTLTVDDGLTADGLRLVRVADRPPQPKTDRSRRKRKDKSRRQARKTDVCENRLLVGQWKAQADNITGITGDMMLDLRPTGTLTFSFEFTGSFEYQKSEVSILATGSVQGSWREADNRISFHTDPYTLDIDMDFQVTGVPDDQAEQIRQTLQQESENVKTQIGMNLLESLPTGDNLPISHLDTTTLVINDGAELTRISDNEGKESAPSPGESD